ncbi:hypothetical protein FRC06_002945 [Ceratobasidium sp. 370]|nr:hypothetical protein FRC06_002945 [Ceratobasidium sp. 370]
MNYHAIEVDGASLYFVGDIDMDGEPSDPEPYSSSSTASSSTETLTESVVHDFLQEINGRMFPSDANAAISLPQDSAEIQRCVNHHQVIRMTLQSSYWGPVEHILAPTQGEVERKRVFDMVTAEGSWVQEMAQQFPHVDFLSVDNVPLTCHTPKPNILFEVYDLYNGIVAPDASFDVVHIRQSTAHFRDPHRLIRDVHRILKPGGLFLFGDSELDAYDGMDHESPAGHKLPGLTAAMQFVRQAFAQQGVNPYLWRDLPELLAPKSDLWASPRDIDGNKHIGFRNIRRKAHLVPANTWPKDEQSKELGRLAGNVWKSMWKSMEVPLQVYGASPDKARRIIQDAIDDIDRTDIAVAAKYHTIYAYKI